jgi:murein DD-endopeptidase MepM/ murein hydrolase activator NlpD
MHSASSAGNGSAGTARFTDGSAGTARFASVLELPPGAPVFDLSRGFAPPEVETARYGIGKYDEHRPGLYTSKLFIKDDRTVHMGIDLFAPVGTPVHAFADGEIHLVGYNSEPLDYGCTVVTRHRLGREEAGNDEGFTLYALHGHLNRASLEGKREGQPIRRGEIIAWVGPKEENGGWLPHLHFQLSFARPDRPDMPGVVTLRDRALARLKYPDPRLVLGPIY